jgi:hypothetical protein
MIDHIVIVIVLLVLRNLTWGCIGFRSLFDSWGIEKQ